jgi:hypothetical protein
VIDPARLLVMAAVLSAATLAVFAAQVRRLEASGPARLVGELRLSQWAAILLAATGALPIGLAAAGAAGAMGNLAVTLGVGFVVAAGAALQCEPRTAIRLIVAAFVLHALSDIAHRPGWLSTEILPHPFAVASAVADTVTAAICYWGSRR